MADRLILNKEHLKSFLRKLGKKHELIAPVKNAGGDTLLEVIHSVDEVTLDLKTKPVMPPKNFFYPAVRPYSNTSVRVTSTGLMRCCMILQESYSVYVPAIFGEFFFWI